MAEDTKVVKATKTVRIETSGDLFDNLTGVFFKSGDEVDESNIPLFLQVQIAGGLAKLVK